MSRQTTKRVLPSELWEKIASFLTDPQDAAALAATSRIHRQATRGVIHEQRMDTFHQIVGSSSTRKLSSWLSYVRKHATISDIDAIVRKIRSNIRNLEESIVRTQEQTNEANNQEHYHNLIDSIANYKVAIAISNFLIYMLQVQRVELGEKSPPNPNNAQKALNDALQAVNNGMYDDFMNMSDIYIKIIAYMYKKIGLNIPNELVEHMANLNISSANTSSSH